jgi:hypothetical protein
MTTTQHIFTASSDVVVDDYCPVCGRPDNYCEVCGAPHDPHRQHARVPGEEVRLTRDDMIAVEREVAAWEESREYEIDVHGVRAHAAQLRALARKLSVLLQYTA